MNGETAFEKRRGVSQVEVRPGSAQVHVTGLAEPLIQSRLGVLRAMTDAGVSLDFLKLTPNGLSFLVPEDRAEDVHHALEDCGARFDIAGERATVIVHAVGMRDEEGLIARIVQATIAAGASVDPLGDMHDRMLLVIPSEQAERVAEHLRAALETA